MDFTLPEPEAGKPGKTDAIVHCCISERYFRRCLEKIGAAMCCFRNSSCIPDPSCCTTLCAFGSAPDRRMRSA